MTSSFLLGECVPTDVSSPFPNTQVLGDTSLCPGYQHQVILHLGLPGSTSPLSVTQLKKINASEFFCSLGRGPAWEGDISGVGDTLGEEACLGKGLTWKECVSEEEACLGEESI